MRLAFLMLAAVINPVFAGDLAQTNQLQAFSFLSVPKPASTNQLEGLSPWNSGSDSNHCALNHVLTNPPPALPANKTLFAFDGRPSQPMMLRPGVYRAVPYTCLVLVLCQQYDAESVRHPELTGVEKMPTLNPDVRLIPYSPAKK